jgi:histidinol-phosphate aminotransferase
VEDDEYAAMQLNRYPSPSHDDIKEKFSAYRGFKYGKQGTFLGVGSDEIIDLLIRVTCTPGSNTGDKILSEQKLTYSEPPNSC